MSCHSWHNTTAQQASHQIIRNGYSFCFGVVSLLTLHIEWHTSDALKARASVTKTSKRIEWHGAQEKPITFYTCRKIIRHHSELLEYWIRGVNVPRLNFFCLDASFGNIQSSSYDNSSHFSFLFLFLHRLGGNKAIHEFSFLLLLDCNRTRFFFRVELDSISHIISSIYLFVHRQRRRRNAIFIYIPKCNGPHLYFMRFVLRINSMCARCSFTIGANGAWFLCLYLFDTHLHR